MKPLKLKWFCEENNITYGWLYYRIHQGYYPIQRVVGGFYIEDEILDRIKKDYQEDIERRNKKKEGEE